MNHNHRFHIVRVSQQSKHSQSHNHMELPVRAWWPAASAPPAGRRRPRSASVHRAHRRPPGRPPRAAPCSLEAGKAPARRRPGSLGRQWPPRSLAPPPAPGGWGRPLRVRGPDPLGAGGLRATRAQPVAGGAAPRQRPPRYPHSDGYRRSLPCLLFPGG